MYTWLPERRSALDPVIRLSRCSSRQLSVSIVGIVYPFVFETVDAGIRPARKLRYRRQLSLLLLDREISGLALPLYWTGNY